MSVVVKARASAAALVMSGSLLLAACSSSGGSTSVSQSDLEKKLNSDTTVSSLKSQLPAKYQSKFPLVVSCIAKAMKKDVPAGQLSDYVKGTKKITDLSGDEKQVSTDIETCAKTALGVS